MLAHQNYGQHFYVRKSPDNSELILIAGTRVALGVGIGLLLADKFADNERKGAGWALVAVGSLSTVPIAMNSLGKSEVVKR